MIPVIIVLMCAFIIFYQTFRLAPQIAELRALLEFHFPSPSGLHVNYDAEEPSEYVEAEPTVEALEAQEKQKDFNERIARIKEELANKQSKVERTGYSADELHPDVKNLPHNSISDYQGIPDVEYAD